MPKTGSGTGTPIIVVPSIMSPVQTFKGNAADKLFIKYPYEEKVLRADFTNLKASGDILIGVVITATLDEVDKTSEMIGTNSVSIDYCDFFIKGGTVPYRHKVQCKAVTQSGAKPEIVIDVKVVSDIQD